MHYKSGAQVEKNYYNCAQENRKVPYENAFLVYWLNLEGLVLRASKNRENPLVFLVLLYF
ncbi:hypothetical protein DJ66_1290 [Candidatus Liberibacter solanacearum]|uniref:Uncharacterized protein n=1 Tax=Candidatus Liberibacter solanacearum TaxID=556287 RepID=A0A0F4VIQ5_9HYPH|nr:hypothetical protein DJ66_1290 [Candidatus Liberibacter solanacearum]